MLTHAIALGFGLYALAAGAAMVTAPDRGRAIVTDLRDNAGLSFVCGVLVFFIGAVLLTAHHKTDTPLQTVVTAVAALAVLKGLILVAWGPTYIKRMTPMLSGNLIRLWGLMALIAGGALVYAGSSGH